MANILTALDLHIEVLQGLQKVDSFQQDMFLPEEIDLHLNKQQDRFIESMFNRGFEDQQVRLDYIKNLIVKNLSLPIIQNQELLDNADKLQSGYVTIPSDYLHLVSDRSRLAIPEKCNNVLQQANYIDYQENYAVLELPKPGNTTPFYENFEIRINNVSVYKTSLTLTDPDYISVLVKDVLDNINLDKFTTLSKRKVYWEYFRGEYYPNAFIFVKDIKEDQAVSAIGFPNSFTIETDFAKSIAAIKSNTFKVVDRDYPFNNQEEKYTRALVENKLSENSEIYEFRKNVFYNPSAEEPQSMIAGGRIYTYGGNSFIITDTVIDYVRKPRQISLALNQGCELSGTAPRLIVDATIEYLKLVIENPSYQAVLQDNQIRNQNTIKNG